MSQWTHINGCIRIDGIPAIEDISKADVKKVFGNTCDYDSPDSQWHLCNVPCGSEGSLQYEILQVGDGMVLYTVPIWGDLRDYDDVEAIKKWFDKITSSGLMIRSAVLQIHVEGKKPIVLSAV